MTEKLKDRRSATVIYSYIVNRINDMHHMTIYSQVLKKFSWKFRYFFQRMYLIQSSGPNKCRHKGTQFYTELNSFLSQLVIVYFPKLKTIKQAVTRLK